MLGGRRPAIVAQHALHLVLQLQFLFLEGDFFELLGFRVAAQRPNYYTRPEEDALILWRDSLDTSS